jgi:hypothetical protein
MSNDAYNNRKGAVQGPLGPRTQIEPQSKTEILFQGKKLQSDWKPAPSTLDGDERYLGPITRYTIEHDNEKYNLTIRRTLNEDVYVGIITKDNRAIGSLNHRGFSQSLNSTLLNIIVDLATPSARKYDKELANLADLAKDIIAKELPKKTKQKYS